MSVSCCAAYVMLLLMIFLHLYAISCDILTTVWIWCGVVNSSMESGPLVIMLMGAFQVKCIQFSWHSGDEFAIEWTIWLQQITSNQLSGFCKMWGFWIITACFLMVSPRFLSNIRTLLCFVKWQWGLEELCEVYVWYVMNALQFARFLIVPVHTCIFYTTETYHRPCFYFSLVSLHLTNCQHVYRAKWACVWYTSIVTMSPEANLTKRLLSWSSSAQFLIL